MLDLAVEMFHTVHMIATTPGTTGDFATTPGYRETAAATTHEVILPLFQPKPTKKYRTLVADPPWRIGTLGFKEMGGIKESLAYSTMTQQELLNLPVGMWADDKAHLYLWTTNAMLGDALELCKAWGFKFSTLITWIKRGDPRTDGWMGLGRYYRITTEHILFGVRGGLDVLNKDQPNLLEEVIRNDAGFAFYAKRGRHSEKPAGFYDMVERTSPGPYLDVFARTQRFNWDTWGNECFIPDGLPTPEDVAGAS